MAVLSSLIYAVFICNVATGNLLGDNEIYDPLYDNFEITNSHLLLRNIRQIFGVPNIENNYEHKYKQLTEDVNYLLNQEWGDIERNSLLDLNDSCAKDLAYVAFHLNKDWAQKMLDADGKLPPGILSGNVQWTGSYRECLSVSVPPQTSKYLKRDGFGGKYCSVTMGGILPPTFPLKIGLCVPDTCTGQDFLNVTKFQHLITEHKILSKLNNTMGFSNKTAINITIQNIECQEKDMKYSTGAIAVLTIIYILVFLAGIGTSLTISENILSLQRSQTKIVSVNDDNLFENENAETEGKLISNDEATPFLDIVKDFFKCFCMITNGKKILNTTSKGGTEFNCIHGIRFLSMAWVILCHTYLFSLLGAGNMLDVLSFIQKAAFQLIMQGSYSVDSFFVMSGFLLTYLFLKEMDKRNGKISWLAFYLHRYLRLTPVYALLLGFDAVLTLYLSSGPLKPSSYATGCTKYWWWNLLYINNFYSNQNACFGHAWYLANDMQFYVISPLFLYFLWKRPKIGLGIIFSLFCACWISNFTIGYVNESLPTLGYIPQNINDTAAFTNKSLDYFDQIYNKPYTRIGPYLIGVFVGYLLYQCEGRKKFLPVGIQIMGWTLSTIMGFLMIFVIYKAKLDRTEAALFLAFSRSCFSASLGWVIFACLTGHGDPVNNLLSHPLFIPLGRLTYCAYLVHPIIMSIYNFSLPAPLIMTHGVMVFLFFGFLMISYGMAFVISLLIESPTMAIEKFFRNSEKK